MEASDKIEWNVTPVKPVEKLTPAEGGVGRIDDGPKDATFKNLLEDIERLRIEGKKLGEGQNPRAESGAEDLDEALGLADRTHENAMDMRRKLEDAFRRHVTG